MDGELQAGFGNMQTCGRGDCSKRTHSAMADGNAGCPKASTRPQHAQPSTTHLAPLQQVANWFHDGVLLQAT